MGLFSRLPPALGLLLACTVALAGGAGAGSSKADLATDLRTIRAGLFSSREQDRDAAFDRLEALLPQIDASGRRDLVRPLGDVLARRPPPHAARALSFLAQLPGPKACSLWLGALRGERHPSVFMAAVEAVVHRREEPRTVRLLLERARDERASVADRALALEALGLVGGGPARLLLGRPLGGSGRDGTEDWLLASGRALGLGRLGDEAALASLVDLLAHPHVAPRVHAWEGLQRITGVRLPLDGRVWRRHIADRRDAGACPHPLERLEDRYRGRKPLHAPRYYGIPVDRPLSHVVFCLDVSQSMYGRGIDTARRQLHAALVAFPTTYRFDVVAFNEHVLPFAGELWPAHPVVKARALAWIAGLETISYTNLFDAVEVAFGHGGLGPCAVPDPVHLDAVFLLSDGAPNRGRIRDSDRIVAALAALSRGRVPVHTIAAGEEVFPLMKRIADATGGRFVDAFLFD